MFCSAPGRTAQVSTYGVSDACTSSPASWLSLHFANFFFRFAEMITGYPLFRGRDNADQLVQIMKIVGTPSDATIAQIKLNSVSPDILVRGE